MLALAYTFLLCTISATVAVPLERNGTALAKRGPISACPTSMGATNIGGRLFVWCLNADYQGPSSQVVGGINAIGDCVALCARTTGCAFSVYDKVRCRLRLRC